MTDEYEIKFFKNGEELKTEEVPTERINGAICALRNEVDYREYKNRVFKKSAEQINSKHSNSEEDYE
jgi:hypothetical protein